MKRRCALFTTLMLALFLTPAAALAAAKVSIKIKAEKEIVSVKGGKKEVRTVSATKFAPNDLIIYTITYTNTGNEPATNAVVDDPIPAGTSYVPGSAKGEGSEIVFSIDKGKSFEKPTLLTYEVTGPAGKKEKQIAAPEAYTTVRWIVAHIPPKATGKLEFKVRVK